jgi:hypothetical protein
MWSQHAVCDEFSGFQLIVNDQNQLTSHLRLLDICLLPRPSDKWCRCTIACAIQLYNDIAFNAHETAQPGRLVKG